MREKLFTFVFTFGASLMGSAFIYYLTSLWFKPTVQSIVLSIAVIPLAILIAKIFDTVKKRHDFTISTSGGTLTIPQSDSRLYIVKCLLRLITSSQEEQENIIGDLLEEFSGFNSKVKAYLWLYKQILKSALPLAYKNLKRRLSSYLGERIR